MPEEEMFPATNGQVTGVAGLVMAATASVFAFTVIDQRYALPVLAIAFLLGVLTYAGVLRPRVGLSGEELVLRQMFSTTRIPLAAVQDVDVKHMTLIRVAGHRYDTPALSRQRRPRRRDSVEPDQTVSEHIEGRITQAMAQARNRAGVAEWSDEQELLAAQVRTEWSWPLVALAVIGVVAVVLTVAL